MRINHNMSAVIANSMLKTNENKLASAVERLSSGLRINHASDDAAGMAISNKMSAQIKGVGQASRNGSDGISIIETAEASMSEVQSILQRMRELSVQSANDTNAIEDREAIQDEINALINEVDRLSTDTEFNAKKVLDGSLQRRTYTNNYDVRIIEISDKVIAAEDYNIEIANDARQAVFVGGSAGTTTPDYYYDGTNVSNNSIIDPAYGTIVAASGTLGEASYNPGGEGNIFINGVQVVVKAGDSAEDIYTKLRDAAERADVFCFVTDTPATAVPGTDVEHADYPVSASPYSFANPDQCLVFATREFGSEIELNIRCDNEYLAQMLGLGTSSTPTDEAVTDITVHGVDMELKNLSTVPGEEAYLTGRYVSPTVSKTVHGNRVEFTDVSGFKMTIENSGKFMKTAYTDVSLDTYLTGAKESSAPVTPATSDGSATLEVTDIGMMTLQVGANEGQILDVEIMEMSSKSLGIDKINLQSNYGAGRAIETLDKALSKVSIARAKLGAAQNRLEHLVASLNATEENMTSALSRIQDLDMAEGMTEYTQNTILTQAATSVLGQANDLPQQVLQLLS